MTDDPAHGQAPRRTRGAPYYFFCSAGCRTKFLAEPARYLAPPRQSRHSQSRRRDLYLPDAPEIRHERPGSCPICGMALEPLAVTAPRAEP